MPLAAVHTLVGAGDRSSVFARMLAGEHTKAPTAGALALNRRPMCESSAGFGAVGSATVLVVGQLVFLCYSVEAEDKLVMYSN